MGPVVDVRNQKPKGNRSRLSTISRSPRGRGIARETSKTPPPSTDADVSAATAGLLGQSIEDGGPAERTPCALLCCPPLGDCRRLALLKVDTSRGCPAIEGTSYEERRRVRCSDGQKGCRSLAIEGPKTGGDCLCVP